MAESRLRTYEKSDKGKTRKRDYEASDVGKLVHRRWILKARYGITLEQFDQLMEDQNGACLLCGAKPGTARNPRQYLDVDHDHETGEVRGLL